MACCRQAITLAHVDPVPGRHVASDGHTMSNCYEQLDFDRALFDDDCTKVLTLLFGTVFLICSLCHFLLLRVEDENMNIS